MYQLIIRNGNIVDGGGGAGFIGDVAIDDGVIVAVGKVEGEAAREIDATGKLVTPGFVDIHTHYDGQAIWSHRMAPSSSHGVTTAVMGNCGVGFAPCRPADHDLLVDVMAGVEDIPGVVMTAGLPWDWETFPEYLDAVDARPRDIDVAAFLPHSPLRVYVMGQRGADQEKATDDDLKRMRALAAEATRAGAIGFASSQMMMHRTASGRPIPSHDAAEAELQAIAEGMLEGGGGLLQAIPEIAAKGYGPVLSPLIGVAQRTGQPLTFTLSTGNDMGTVAWQEAIRLVEEANAAGARVTGQVFPRPIGLVIGLEASANPFTLCKSYQEIAGLPLAARVAAMREPARRAAILAEPPVAGHPITKMARNWNWMFPLAEEPDYEPAASESIAASAAAKGVAPEAEAYDRMLEDDGKALLMVAMGNYEGGKLDTVRDLMRHEHTVVGLGDGGAHYGMVCDAGYPTFMLTHWARDRKSGRIDVPAVVKALTSETAEVAGLLDRGRLRPGYKADINVIDLERMKLFRPEIVQDLPGGGRRLDQKARGYVATIVAGVVIAENDQPTAALPGKLVRGRQAAPSVH